MVMMVMVMKMMMVMMMMIDSIDVQGCYVGKSQ